MRFYESGSRRQQARPFYRQAIAGFEREAEAALLVTLKEAVETAEGSAD